MAIQLKKGQRTDLTKDRPTIKKYKIGLGWNPNVAVGKAFDLDASAFCLNAADKLPDENYFVYYNNLQSPDGAVVHSGDNLTGHGDGDDELLIVDFSKIDSSVTSIVFVVSIYEAALRGQNFGQVSGAFIRIEIVKDPNTPSADPFEPLEVARFDLSEEYSTETSMTFGKLYKHGEEWKFQAVGTGIVGDLDECITLYI